MKRKIINIHEDKCNGCGLCVTACHEGAIELVNGKAKLVSDVYCDGLGDCLPSCPTGAIEIIERDAKEFDEEKVKQRMEERAKEEKKTISHKHSEGFTCPGMQTKTMKRDSNKQVENNKVEQAPVTDNANIESELMQWPVQLKLINPNAPYLQGANILIAADCTAYAYGNFHRDFIKDHVTIIACPKLDDNNYNTDKLSEIIANNDIKSIKVVKMEVPCCNGIVSAVKTAMLNAQKIVEYKEVTITTDGRIRN